MSLMGSVSDMESNQKVSGGGDMDWLRALWRRWPVPEPRRPRPFIPYDIPLGVGDRVRLVLPADLTQREADRICGVIQTLPMPEAS